MKIQLIYKFKNGATATMPPYGAEDFLNPKNDDLIKLSIKGKMGNEDIHY